MKMKNRIFEYHYYLLWMLLAADREKNVCIGLDRLVAGTHLNSTPGQVALWVFFDYFNNFTLGFCFGPQVGYKYDNSGGSWVRSGPIWLSHFRYGHGSTWLWYHFEAPQSFLGGP